MLATGLLGGMKKAKATITGISRARRQAEGPDAVSGHPQVRRQSVPPPRAGEEIDVRVDPTDPQRVELA